MDAFTYIAEFFASPAEEEVSVPMNEEAPNSGPSSQFMCVIA
jgi:hypothetical protein